MLIPCPWCGDREDVEFRYGGASEVAYPKEPEAVDDASWAHFLFFRPNPKGPMPECWVHTAGCRRWFALVRDTVTHEITPTPTSNGDA